MTTKKQRRAMVAAKRAAYDAETRRMGLEALERSKQKQVARKSDDKDELSKINRKSFSEKRRLLMEGKRDQLTDAELEAIKKATENAERRSQWDLTRNG